MARGRKECSNIYIQVNWESMDIEKGRQEGRCDFMKTKKSRRGGNYGWERQEGWQGKAGRTKGRDRKDDTNVDTVSTDRQR